MARQAAKRVADEPAFILHTRAYRETSALLECITSAHGRIGLVVRGLRRERSRFPRGLLQPLQPLMISWAGQGELVTLTGAEAASAPLTLSGERLYSAMYLNELVLRLTPRGDPQGNLFDLYRLCLQRLADGESEGWSLRRFERDLLEQIGYALVLDTEADLTTPIIGKNEYVFVPDEGPSRWIGQQGALRVRGDALLAMARDTEPAAADADSLRRLMRVLLRHQLGGADLNAWSMTRMAKST
ncbi:MAG: DNA repair protein RecO [Dokdonella sp.]